MPDVLLVRSLLLPALSRTSVGAVTEARSPDEVASLIMLSQINVCVTDSIAAQDWVSRAMG